MVSKVGERCVGCGSCVSACPAQCLTLRCNNDGFWYPILDEVRCAKCGLCIQSCPVLTQKEYSEYEKKVFAIQAKDEGVVEKSSSGGAFYLLASKIIKDGGYVCGVEVDKDSKIRHTIVADLEGLDRLLGSKYVQSEIGEIYTSVQALLNSEKKVLFSGTPCQVSGLLSFLGKKYDNLLTVDVICHGVSSPYIWQRYIEYQENKHKSKVVNVSFRDKTNGWKNYGMRLSFGNGESYFNPMRNDAFLSQFIENLCLRETCYACEFKGYSRNSDITLGDFWGKDESYPELKGDKGHSLVIVNTEKGKAVIEANADLNEGYEVGIEKVLQHNNAYFYSVEQSPYRTRYIKSVTRQPFDKATKKYLRIISLKRRVRFYLRKFKSFFK